VVSAPEQQPSPLPRVQTVSAVLWPSFVLAGLATVVFFALLDPLSILDVHGEPPLSRTAAYSLGFFGFWLLTAASSLATLYFLNTRVPPPKRIDPVPDDPQGDT
jgi:hypothetical protein